MQTQIEVPFSKLKPDPANVRKTDTAPSEQFVASVRAEGILEPLTVRPNGDGYFVTNGGKRLAALAIIVKDKSTKVDDPLVPCIVREIDEKTARNISLAVNYHRDTVTPRRREPTKPPVTLTLDQRVAYMICYSIYGGGCECRDRGRGQVCDVMARAANNAMLEAEKEKA